MGCQTSKGAEPQLQAQIAATNARLERSRTAYCCRSKGPDSSQVKNTMLWLRYVYLTSEAQRERFRRAEPGSKLSQEELDNLLATEPIVVKTAAGEPARLSAEAKAIWRYSLSEASKRALRAEFFAWETARAAQMLAAAAVDELADAFALLGRTIPAPTGNAPDPSKVTCLLEYFRWVYNTRRDRHGHYRAGIGSRLPPAELNRAVGDACDECHTIYFYLTAAAKASLDLDYQTWRRTPAADAPPQVMVSHV